MEKRIDVEVSGRLVAVGIVLATIGAFVSGLGMVLMRASGRYEKHLPWYKRPKLGIGVLLMAFVNTALDTMAMAVAPLAVVAPIGGITIVATVLYARMGVAGPKEPVSSLQWTSIAIVVLGVALVDIYGPKSDPVLDSDKILSHMYEQSFLIYQACAFVASGSAVLFLAFSGVDRGGARTAFVTSIGSGMCSGVTMVIMKVMSSCVGSFLINWSLPFSNPRFWVASAELAVYAAVLIILLQYCMACRDVALATALYQSSLIICTIIAANAFYSELRGVELERLIVFFCGVMCVMTGLALLVLLRQEDTHSSGETNALNTTEDTTELVEAASHDEEGFAMDPRSQDNSTERVRRRMVRARDSVLLKRRLAWIWRARSRQTPEAQGPAAEEAAPAT
jgi:multidrug transporter EmrE-like cation transporter